MNISNINVSAIIPTIGRESLFRSLDSVYKQQFKPTEIIISYDGDNFEEFKNKIEVYLEKINENIPLYLINVGPFSGGNTARQAGINKSVSEYIALLDDDDIWHTDHLLNYVKILCKSQNGKLKLLSCKANIIDITLHNNSIIVPPRLIHSNESIPDYLFKVNNIKADLGFIQSSLILFSKDLALSVPFDINLKYHQDIDWLLRVSQSGIDFEFIQSDLITVTYYSTPLSVSKKISAVQSLRWSLNNFKDKRCLGDFILTQSYNYARKNGRVVDELYILYASFVYGKPGIYALARFMLKLFRIDNILKILKKNKK
ncbi:glycosyltransferase family 2 protein [Escherichia coli]|jgi:Predicted glycosyltransferases|uniref:Glycosyltransferase family 2 protein n=8 Tax=Escherichia coli TaxID=562 RepID=A0A1J1DXP5_ECOLX|nr:glycosyltransferase family A protein [Escherichia coli]AZU84284.1 glycosyltransferase family 2 protein [Escherichia coli]EEW1588585.1 glycosyltransferase family 2 protein [Escherichia coli]EEW2314184.1 glycosyltransferase family 2 protein [Escherichia coli]EFB6130227.1 glycosyltransferase family 2 protein [Escherichia coli]EFB6597654.1 glycosyltransferase family 2 protein [Escherichia coli]